MEVAEKKSVTRSPAARRRRAHQSALHQHRLPIKAGLLVAAQVAAAVLGDGVTGSIHIDKVSESAQPRRGGSSATLGETAPRCERAQSPRDSIPGPESSHSAKAENSKAPSGRCWVGRVACGQRREGAQRAVYSTSARVGKSPEGGVHTACTAMGTGFQRKFRRPCGGRASQCTSIATGFCGVRKLRGFAKWRSCSAADLCHTAAPRDPCTRLLAAQQRLRSTPLRNLDDEGKITT